MTAASAAGGPEEEASHARDRSWLTRAGAWIRQRGALAGNSCIHPTASSERASPEARFWRIRGVCGAIWRHLLRWDRRTQSERRRDGQPRVPALSLCLEHYEGVGGCAVALS